MKRSTALYWRRMAAYAQYKLQRARTTQARYRWTLLRLMAEYAVWVIQPEVNMHNHYPLQLRQSIRAHLYNWPLVFGN